MNQYKVEMKEIFRKEILVCAESEREAMDIVEKAYLRTNMLDNSYKELDAVETKIIDKKEENCEDEENIIDQVSRECIEETVEEMQENLNKIEDALIDDDIVCIDMLIEDLEDNIEDLKEVVREIE